MLNILPQTNIISAIDGDNKTLKEEDSTYSADIRFVLNGSDDKKVSRFECSFQDQKYRPCTSPEPKGDLQPGLYVFRVKAIDSDQAEDPSPAMFSLRVLTSALVQGSIQEKDRPAANLRVALDNKTDSFTDVIGKFFFQGVPKGFHQYWIYDRVNNPLAGPITLIIAAGQLIQDEGVIVLDGLQPVFSGQTIDPSTERLLDELNYRSPVLPAPGQASDIVPSNMTIAGSTQKQLEEKTK